MKSHQCLTKLATVATCLLASLTYAEIVIPSQCLEQTESFGRTINGATKFDQTDAIADKMPASFVPSSYSFCLSEPDEENFQRLRSFSITYSSLDKSKYYSLSRVGPAGGTCFNDNEFTDWDEYGHFDFAQISRNENQVTRMTTYFTGSGTSLTIGPIVALDTNKRYPRVGDDSYKEQGKQIIGFWGSQTDTAIAQLGLILMDTACVQENGEEKEVQDNTDFKEPTGGDTTQEPTNKTVSFSSKVEKSDVVEIEEDSDVVLIVVIILIVVVVVAILIILITHFITRRNKNKVTILKGETLGDGTASNGSVAIPQMSDGHDGYDSKRALGTANP